MDQLAPNSIFIGRRKTREDLAREKIATIEDVPTLYRPVRNCLMVKPLPEVGESGGVILPDSSVIQYNEGHVVAQGSLCSGEIKVGDCVTWEPQSAQMMTIEGVRFAVMMEQAVIMRIPREKLQAETQQDVDRPLNVALTAEQTAQELHDLGHRPE